MNEPNKEQYFCKDYPWYIILLRWVFTSIIFALGIYISYHLNQMLSLVYVIYCVFGLTLVLPLSRCIYCYYHGRWCNTGWGKIAGYLFNKGDEEKYLGKFPFSILLYPFWLLPLLVGALQVLRQRNLVSLALFLGYGLLLFLEKVILKLVACQNCRQRTFCPALPFREKQIG